MPPKGEAFRLYGFLPFHHTPAGSLGQWEAADKMKGRSGVWAYDLRSVILFFIDRIFV